LAQRGITAENREELVQDDVGERLLVTREVGRLVHVARAVVGAVELGVVLVERLQACRKPEVSGSSDQRRMPRAGAAPVAAASTSSS